MSNDIHKIEYRSADPPKWRAYLRWLMPRAAIAIAVLGILLFGLWYLLQGRFRAREGETDGFLTLRLLAKQMTQAGAPGVVVGKDNDPEFIGSFDDFFKYVASQRPAAVSTKDAPNPFPGILPGKAYGRMEGISPSGDRPLIWSSVEFSGKDGNVRDGLTCDGNIHFWGTWDANRRVFDEPTVPLH